MATRRLKHRYNSKTRKVGGKHLKTGKKSKTGKKDWPISKLK